MVTQEINPNKAYRITEVAEFLNLSNADVMRLIDQGTLRGYSMPTGRGRRRQYLTFGEAVLAYLASKN